MLFCQGRTRLKGRSDDGSVEQVVKDGQGLEDERSVEVPGVVVEKRVELVGGLEAAGQGLILECEAEEFGIADEERNGKVTEWRCGGRERVGDGEQVVEGGGIGLRVGLRAHQHLGDEARDGVSGHGSAGRGDQRGLADGVEFGMVFDRHDEVHDRHGSQKRGGEARLLAPHGTREERNEPEMFGIDADDDGGVVVAEMVQDDGARLFEHVWKKLKTNLGRKKREKDRK